MQHHRKRLIHHRLPQLLIKTKIMKIMNQKINQKRNQSNPKTIRTTNNQNKKEIKTKKKYKTHIRMNNQSKQKSQNY